MICTNKIYYHLYPFYATSIQPIAYNFDNSPVKTIDLRCIAE